MVIRSPAVYQQIQTLSYHHHYVVPDGVSETLGDTLTSGFYASGRRAMRFLSLSPSSHLAFPAVLRTLEAIIVESDVEDVVEGSTNNDTNRKQIAVPDFDPQSYTR